MTHTPPMTPHAYFDQFNTMKMMYMKTSETMFSISNATLTLMLLILLLLMWNNNNKMMPTRLSLMSKMPHTLSYSLTKEHLNPKQHTHMMLMLSLLTMLLSINSLGLLPYVFTTTSHIMMTFSLSLTIMTSSTMKSMLTHKSQFLSMFTPHSTPTPLAPFLVLMETASYAMRAVSLGVRLAANISAGHLLLTILSSFTFNMLLSKYYLLSLFPMTILSLMTLLEMTMALIQAYVFSLLSAMYYSDTMQLH